MSTLDDLPDIEDIFVPGQDRISSSSNSSKSTVVISADDDSQFDVLPGKSRRKNKSIAVEADNNDDQDDDDGSCALVFPKQMKRRMVDQEAVGYDIPGTQKIFMKTYGCSHNSSDGEYMAGQLVDYGYTVTDVFEGADAFLINSCTVKNPSQDTFVNLVRKAKNTGNPVIVTGCVPQGEPNSKEWDGLSVIGVQEISRVVEAVEEALRGNTVRFLKRSKRNKPSLALPKIRRNPYIEIIPINMGCLNQCTYCKTKHARGHLQSYTPEEILERVENVVLEGVVEIRMTSEDTGAYGRDLNTNVGYLLKEVVKLLPDGVMLRVGMTNPPYILDQLEDMAEILSHPNVFSFLHIPVQAGSDKVLEDMKREYTVDEFEQVVEFLRENVPGITIATDIICGFPTESEEDFKETLALVEKHKFPVLNISQMYPRPGTQAAKMKRVPTQEVKRRSRACTKVFESYRTFDDLVGTTTRVWFSGEMATDKVNLVGHTKNYVQVLVPPDQAKFGVSAMCKITKATKFSVFGEVVGDLIYPTMPEGGKMMSPKNKGKVTLTKRKTKTETKPNEQDNNNETSKSDSKQKSNPSSNNTMMIIWIIILIVLIAMKFLA